MNRGSGRAFQFTEAAATGFNEAPIHESGKCHDRFRPGSSPGRLQ